MVRGRNRKDIVTATTMVLETLKSGEPFTLNKLTARTGLNFRTVKKVLELLERSQSALLEKKIDVLHADKLTVIQMKEKTGLASLPEHVQHLIIKTAYYPTVSREEEILSYLLLQNAVDARSRLVMQKDVTLEELVEAGHIEEKDGRYYLTSVGKMVAEGALKLYPELKTVRERMQVTA